MESNYISLREKKILQNLCHLPRKMLSIHPRNNMTEFVLHDISDKECFNLRKAAYLIDNPDFDCLKGVAGYCVNEKCQCQNIWQQPDAFSEHMQKSNFNSKVRDINSSSIKLSKQDDSIQKIASMLQIENPVFFTWDMKHDNYAILIVEKQDNADHELDHHIESGASFLGFCPIF